MHAARISERPEGFTSPASVPLASERRALPLSDARWDWHPTSKILVVRLRSIGDAVLSTASLLALRRFLPKARIDVLLQDWVAPLLEGFTAVDNVISVKEDTVSRARVAAELRRAQYDVAYNLHGGATATFLTFASFASHRVGYAGYRYARLHNQRAPSSAALWKKDDLHSVEQQLGLIGWTGVPVTDRPRTALAITPEARAKVAQKLEAHSIDPSRRIALIHPAAAFDTKRWATEKFAQVVDYLSSGGFSCVSLTGPGEEALGKELVSRSQAPMTSLSDLSLPEVTALADRSSIFVGNDSGIAHIAAAVSTPGVVIFGSSNVVHWRPWSSAPWEVVREEMPCAPCPGYTCSEFVTPECINRVPVDRVVSAIERVLQTANSIALTNDLNLNSQTLIR